jgi:uncharacterized protein
MALELPPIANTAMWTCHQASKRASICSYECTFCADCIAHEVHNVCPNCGESFVPRPIRPAREWRPWLSIAMRPPSSKGVRLSFDVAEIAKSSERIKEHSPSGALTPSCPSRTRLASRKSGRPLLREPHGALLANNRAPIAASHPCAETASERIRTAALAATTRVRSAAKSEVAHGLPRRAWTAGTPICETV